MSTQFQIPEGSKAPSGMWSEFYQPVRANAGPDTISLSVDLVGPAPENFGKSINELLQLPTPDGELSVQQWRQAESVLTECRDKLCKTRAELVESKYRLETLLPSEISRVSEFTATIETLERQVRAMEPVERKAFDMHLSAKNSAKHAIDKHFSTQAALRLQELIEDRIELSAEIVRKGFNDPKKVARLAALAIAINLLVITGDGAVWRNAVGNYFRPLDPSLSKKLPALPQLAEVAA